jgi:predicted ATP-binding protein involved in virulence
MRIDVITIKNLGPFDNVRIELPQGADPELADIYLLTGPNGCGKTTVLHAIAALVGGDHRHTMRTLPGRVRKGSSKGAEVTLVASEREYSARFGENGGGSLASLGPQAENGRTKWTAFAYAGTRNVDSGHVEAIREPSSNPLERGLSFHDTANTKNLAEWVASQEFLRLKAKETGRHERAEQIAASVRVIEETIADIAEAPDFAFVSGTDFDLDVRVRLHGAILDMDVLPDGVKSIMSWIADLFMRLDRIPWVDDTPTRQRPFLLLLDEIDIHLHPAWQRRVIPVVQKLFPKAQIIASTHSPFVVGSADDAHVITFAVKNGLSVLESSKPSQVGVSYSAVLRDIFGITSEFDVETERMLAKFHAAKTSLLDGTATDRTVVDDLAQKLAARGEELSSIIGFELRQLDRRLKKQTAG